MERYTFYIVLVEKVYRSIAHTMKSGIMERDPQISESAGQTFWLKITLKECDLILLEKPESLHSLALVAHTTAVLNMNEGLELLNANLEIQVSFFLHRENDNQNHACISIWFLQRMNLDWFMIESESGSRCQLTNDFSMTVSLSVESETDGVGQPPKLGLSSIIPVKHQIVVCF